MGGWVHPLPLHPWDLDLMDPWEDPTGLWDLDPMDLLDLDHTDTWDLDLWVDPKPTHQPRSMLKRTRLQLMPRSMRMNLRTPPRPTLLERLRTLLTPARTPRIISRRLAAMWPPRWIPLGLTSTSQ